MNGIWFATDVGFLVTAVDDNGLVGLPGDQDLKLTLWGLKAAVKDDECLFFC